MDLTYIKNKIATAKHIKNLTNRHLGKRIIKNIVEAEILRITTNLGDNGDNSYALDSFVGKFTDMVRPNKFRPLLLIGGVPLDISYLVKDISIPIAKLNTIEYKRAGSTLPLPLNLDNPNKIDINFYSDIDNFVLTEVIKIMKSSSFNYMNYGRQNDNEFIFKVLYPVHMNYKVKNQASSFLTSLASDAVDIGKEFIGKSLLGATDYNFLDGLFFDDDLYRNSGKKEPQAKVMEETQFKYIFEVTYRNCFIENFNNIDFDNERINQYQEYKLNLNFTHSDINLYDLLSKDYTPTSNIKINDAAMAGDELSKSEEANKTYLV